MAHRDNSANTHPKAILEKNPVARHRHFNWLETQAEDECDAQFAAKALDVSRGCRTIGTILCQHLVDLAFMRDDPDDEANRPLLDGGDIEALARLMVVSLGDLSKAADEQIERFNKSAQVGAKS